MKYFVTVGVKTFVVEVEAEEVRVDGDLVPAQLVPIPGTPLHHLLLGPESWTLSAERVDGRSWVMGVGGERFDVAVVDERTRQIEALTGGRARGPAGGVVRAPMPGLVVRIEVAVGDRVRAGAGLVVVEAMKMENELRAPGEGVVTAIHVAQGAAVEKGVPLVTLELTGF